MSVTSARNIVSMKEKGHFETKNEKYEKYTLSDKLPEQLSELVIQPRKKDQPSFSIRKLTASDKDNVSAFLNRFFFRDEPINLAIDLLEGPDDMCPVLEDYAVESIGDGLSVAAVDENDKLVGVLINGKYMRHVKEKSSEEPEPSESEEKYCKVLRVLNHLETNARVWDHLPESCEFAVEVKIASIHESWRGRGLMTALMDETERIAKEEGAGALRMDATSAFSAAAALRRNFRPVYRVKYADIPHGPRPGGPHEVTGVYVKEI